MTESIQDMREERSALAKEARKLHAAWKPEYQERYDTIMAEVDMLDSKIKRRLDSFSAAGAGTRSGDALVNAATGEKIQVVRGDRGPIGQQLAAQGYPVTAPNGETLADFLRGVAGAKTTDSIRAALSEGTDSAGGHMLPSALQIRLLEAMVPASSLLQAGVGMAMLSDGAKSYKVAAVNAIPTAAWRNESATIATSEPTFRGIDIVPRSLAFQFKVSRELLMDAVGIEDALTTAMAQAFAKELDRAGLRGTGTAPEIRGIANVSGIQTVTNGAAGTAQATIKWANLMSAYQAIIAADAPAPTAAIMAPRSLVGFGNLADSTGQPLQMPPLIAGMKMIATSQIPVNLTVGASTDCTEVYVADFTKALFFMRERVSIYKLVELHAGTGEIGFVGHVRADFAPLYPAAFALVTGVRA